MLPKVLVIDDDRALTDMFELTIPYEGFEVFTANSGPEGIESVRKFQPDVVVLDLMMPDMDGWQICQEVRTFSQVPILVLSAVVDSQRMKRALDAGADEYLVKPAPEGALVSHLKKLVQQARKNRQDEPVSNA